MLSKPKLIAATAVLAAGTAAAVVAAAHAGGSTARMTPTAQAPAVSAPQPGQRSRSKDSGCTRHWTPRT